MDQAWRIIELGWLAVCTDVWASNGNAPQPR